MKLLVMSLSFQTQSLQPTLLLLVMMMMRSSQRHPLNNPALHLVRFLWHFIAFTNERMILATDSSAVEALQEEIKGFHRSFNSIKESTIKCLEKCRITVVTVVYLLTSALGECKGFLKTKRKDLRKSEDHWELFEGLNLYWNYLCFSLLHGLIEELFERNKEFGEIKEEMEKYSQDMQKFRARTTLKLFCQVDYGMLGITQQPCPPQGFRNMATEHPWPETVTLKDVEEFRKRFLLIFGLPECAMMVHRIENKCFEITWFGVLPPTVLRLLKEPDIISLLEVSSVEIDGECVDQPLPQLPPAKEETEAEKEDGGTRGT